MEIFKSDFLRKEFKELVEKILPQLNECGSCGFFRCKICKKFLVSKKLLLTSGDETSGNYIANFLTVYFYISDMTASFFNLKISNEVRKANSFVAKSCHKTNDVVENIDRRYFLLLTSSIQC